MVNFNLYELERTELAKLFCDKSPDPGCYLAMLTMIEHDLHMIAAILYEIRKEV